MFLVRKVAKYAEDVLGLLRTPKGELCSLKIGETWREGE